MIFGKYVNRFYKQYWYLIVIGVIALIVVDYFQLQIPAIIGAMINGLSKYKDDTLECDPLTLEMLGKYMIQIGVIGGFMFFGRLIWRVSINFLGVHVETDLRDQMYKHSLKLSREYYNTHKVGEEMALYTNDLNSIRQSFSNGILVIVDALMLGGYAFYLMIKLNVILALLSALPLVIIAVMSGIIGKVMRAKYEKCQKAFADLSDFAQEDLSGITVVKAYVKEAKELMRFNKISKKNKDANLDFVRFSEMLWAFFGLFIETVFIIIIIYAGYIRTNNPGSFYAGDVVTFISYFDTLIWPMMAISRVITLRSQGNASLKRIGAMLDYEIEIKVDNPVDVDIKGHIEFKDLSFSYPGTERLALENISLDIPAGTSVGILGKTGCGKTTLADMLLHIYNVERGKLIIDNVDIMDIDLHTLREGIGYVPQDNFLFSKKVVDNICFGLEENDEEKAKEYARYAAVMNDIESFPEKYNTVIGERGVTMSGGQRQRVSIARAMIKEPAILVLDDSVSAVDTETEEKIITYLKEQRANKTTILIAHRISTVKDLDMIVVIDEGKIACVGTHQELLQTSKLYQDMVYRQQLDDEEGGLE